MKKQFNITFGVGPSHIGEDVKNDIRFALENNILSLSHRSAAFTEISKKAVLELKKFLNLPEDYSVFYTSSATHAWELCALNLVEKEAFAFTLGNFSEAFASNLKSWGKVCHTQNANWGEANNFNEAKIPQSAELIALCHNETSTGVACLKSDIEALKKAHPEKILAVDITSSVACATYPTTSADVWYFSVQKGLGLPSGLGIIALSPNAMKKAEKTLNTNPNAGFFTFPEMEKMMAGGKFQTIQTPNILDIYLLGEQLERFNKTGAKAMEEALQKRADIIYSFFENHPQTKPFVVDKTHRSPYTPCIEMSEEYLNTCKEKAKKEGVELGGGYGKLKNTTMRIANFPSLSDADFEKLFEIFKQ